MRKFGVWVPGDRVLAMPPSLLIDLDLTTLSWYNLQDLWTNCDFYLSVVGEIDYARALRAKIAVIFRERSTAAAVE